MQIPDLVRIDGELPSTQPFISVRAREQGEQMALTSEQQRDVEAILPRAKRLAYKYGKGDDDSESVAMLALCKAVERYPIGCTIPIATYAMLGVKNALKDWVDRKIYERKRGLSGGIEGSKHNDIVAIYDTTGDRLTAIIAALPPQLREFARLRWLDELTIKETALTLNIHPNTVSRYEARARSLATDILTSEGVSCGRRNTDAAPAT